MGVAVGRLAGGSKADEIFRGRRSVEATDAAVGAVARGAVVEVGVGGVVPLDPDAGEKQTSDGGVDIAVAGGGVPAGAGVGTGAEEEVGLAQKAVLPRGKGAGGVRCRSRRGDVGAGAEGGESGAGGMGEAERGAGEVNGGGRERTARRRGGMGEEWGKEEGVGVVVEDEEKGGVDGDEGAGGGAVDLERGVTAAGGGREGEGGRRPERWAAMLGSSAGEGMRRAGAVESRRRGQKSGEEKEEEKEQKREWRRRHGFRSGRKGRRGT